VHKHAVVPVIAIVGACTPFDEGGLSHAASSDGAIDAPGADSAVLGDPDLVLALDLDEPNGATVRDSSGNENHGVVVGAERVPGVSGSALAFTNDGSPSYVLVPSTPSTTFGGESFTVAFFAYLEPPDPSAYSVVLCKPWGTLWQPPYAQFDIELGGPTQSLQLFIGTELGLVSLVSITAPFTVWTHVAFVLGAGSAKGYIDGKETAASPTSFALSARATEFRLAVDGGLRASTCKASERRHGRGHITAGRRRGALRRRCPRG
jgi:hypothetical protein